MVKYSVYLYFWATLQWEERNWILNTVNDGELLSTEKVLVWRHANTGAL